MPDTELMDRVVALIEAVPELHDQQALSCRLPDGASRQIEVRLEGHLEFAGVECSTARCFAGWALVLAGWRLSPDAIVAYPPNDQGDGWSTIAAAASVLGIRPTEAYDSGAERGLFWNWNSLAQIKTWVAYYKGEITDAERNVRLEEE